MKKVYIVLAQKVDNGNFGIAYILDAFDNFEKAKMAIYEHCDALIYNEFYNKTLRVDETAVGSQFFLSEENNSIRSKVEFIQIVKQSVYFD